MSRAHFSSWPGLSRPSTSYFCRAKNVDHRNIGAKQSFVASSGDDEWKVLCITASSLSLDAPSRFSPAIIAVMTGKSAKRVFARGLGHPLSVMAGRGDEALLRADVPAIRVLLALTKSERGSPGQAR